jgi:uncharacterized coiled-coil protein SlyX
VSKKYTRNFDAKYNDETGNFEEDRSERARPRFWIEEVYNKKTGELDKVEMIEILVPGETKNIWAGKVTEDHRRRFKAHYQAFKNNEEMPASGIPLNKLPGIGHQLVQQLKFLGFTSVEDLARATDHAVTEFMGGFTWRKKAQNFLDEQAKTVQAVSEKDQIIATQAKMLEELRQQMAKLSEQMQASLEKKKPGRKPKAEPVPAAA